jgi:hypothetical protein
MLGRWAAAAAIAMLTACAAFEPAGRNAESAPAPAAPAASAPAEPSPAPAPAAPAAAPQVNAPAPAPAPARSGGDIVVPGQREVQTPPPGDPRSNAERIEDIRAWDQCVTHVQAAYERDPMRPQLDTPEDYCARTLGMADRTAVPQSRLERR